MSLYFFGKKSLTENNIHFPNENLLEKSSDFIMNIKRDFVRGIANKVPKDFTGSIFASENSPAGIKANGSRYFSVVEGKYYTQTIWFSTDAPLKNKDGLNMPFLSSNGVVAGNNHVEVKELGNNSYVIFGTVYASKEFINFDIGYVQNFEQAFDFSQERNLTINNIKIEEGTISTEWCPNPSDIAMQSDVDELRQQIQALKNQNGGGKITLLSH